MALELSEKRNTSTTTRNATPWYNSSPIAQDIVDLAINVLGTNEHDEIIRHINTLSRAVNMLPNKGLTVNAIGYAIPSDVEYWQGKGYPQCLSIEEIPKMDLSQVIVSILTIHFDDENSHVIPFMADRPVFMVWDPNRLYTARQKTQVINYLNYTLKGLGFNKIKWCHSNKNMNVSIKYNGKIRGSCYSLALITMYVVLLIINIYPFWRQIINKRTICLYSHIYKRVVRDYCGDNEVLLDMSSSHRTILSKLRSLKNNFKSYFANWVNQSLHFIQEIKDKPFSMHFVYPVNQAWYGINDYYLVIKHPMDLETIQNNLLSDKYQNILEFICDFKLIATNAKTYNNSPNHPIHSDAQLFESYFSERFSFVIGACCDNRMQRYWSQVKRSIEHVN